MTDSRVLPDAPASLLKTAKAVLKNAYAPYSNFGVGAAVETTDGKVYVGANMENASYGLTMCAEVGALQAASSAGALGDIRRIAIVGGPLRPSDVHEPRATPPCGRCRQLIAEASNVGKRDIEVWFSDLDGSVIEKRMISELLPDAFDSLNLE